LEQYSTGHIFRPIHTADVLSPMIFRPAGEIAKSVLRIDRNLAAEYLNQQGSIRDKEMIENMVIRHCVDENLVVTDPTKVRQVVISACRIESMSCLIDPASHLNLDYPDHRIESLTNSVGGLNCVLC
jgi:hypothetical protein